MNADYKDLPDFCNQDVVFSSMIMAEMVAFMLTIVQPGSYDSKLEYLAIASMVIQWILMIDLFLLCFLKNILRRFSGIPFYLLIFLLLQAVTFFVSISSGYLIRLLQLDEVFGSSWQMPFLLQNMLLSVLFSIMIIRYAYLNTRWKNQLIQQSQSRINALQARIRPHFLFNSLNTLSALVYLDPQKAEAAIIDLADLFRASINHKTMIPLKDELDIVRKYLQIEKLRLEERLQVCWKLELQNEQMEVPALMIQPLVENAVYHGIESRQQGGQVLIELSEKPKSLQINIKNPLQKRHSNKKGNRMALNNICERLKLIYHQQAKIEVIQGKDFYQVSIDLPKKR